MCKNKNINENTEDNYTEDTKRQNWYWTPLSAHNQFPYKN